MTCYKLTLAYDGTNYSGWQFQFNAPTVQQHIQNALIKLLKQDKIVLIGSGRTDAGVHAKAQIVHFHYAYEIDLNRFLMSLNGLIPKDIRVKNVEIVADDFHARYSSISKEYHYYIYSHKIMDPFLKLYAWHVYWLLDLDLLKRAASEFIGVHDFTSFANEAHLGASARNPVRTLYRLDVFEERGMIRLEFEGNGFLYKMVRNIVGTLIDVAASRKSIENIKEIFAAKDRRQASKAAPPQGLFLVNVEYPD